jgi:hypothetical protein
MVTFVPTPAALSRVIVGAPAANVRAALDELRPSQASSDRLASRGGSGRPGTASLLPT